MLRVCDLRFPHRKIWISPFYMQITKFIFNSYRTRKFNLLESLSVFRNTFSSWYSRAIFFTSYPLKSHFHLHEFELSRDFHWRTSRYEKCGSHPSKCKLLNLFPILIEEKNSIYLRLYQPSGTHPPYDTRAVDFVLHMWSHIFIFFVFHIFWLKNLFLYFELYFPKLKRIIYIS